MSTQKSSTEGIPEPLKSMKIELHEDIPFVQVRVNDSDPLWFNPDSGASACVIDPAQCQALGISSEGELQATGAGAGPVAYSLARDVHFTVGDESFKTDESYVIDLSGVSTPKDRKLAGLLGSDFFQHYVVAFDYDQSIMSLYDPTTFDYRGSGEVLPLTFKKRVPFVRGKLQVPGQAMAEREWLIDTGSGDTLNDDLLARSTGAKRRVTGGQGLGEKFEIWQATAERVELGRLHLVRVIGFSGGMKVGGGILKNFTVIFDYHGARMILEPNGQYRA